MRYRQKIGLDQNFNRIFRFGEIPGTYVSLMWHSPFP